MTPRVSIVLPVCNGAASVGCAITSLRAQTFGDWELLVIDDGSTDGTPDAVAAAGGGDRRVKLLSRRHEGLVHALNAGLAAARGEFFARMDADDESYPNRLAAQLALLEAQPELGLASCLVEFGGDRTVNAGYALHVDWINSVVSDAEIRLNRFIESPLAHPSVMFRRTLVTRFGGYAAGAFPEDYELWLRWLDAGVRMAKVPQVLLRWNDPPTRLSRTDDRYSPENFFRMKAAWIARAVRHVASGRGVWIWGAGRPTRKRAAHLADHGVSIAGFIDVDPKKTGRSVGGIPVVAPTALPAPGDGCVLGYVSSRGARDLIRNALASRGFQEGQDFLMCA